MHSAKGCHLPAPSKYREESRDAREKKSCPWPPDMTITVSLKSKLKLTQEICNLGNYRFPALTRT